MTEDDMMQLANIVREVHDKTHAGLLDWKDGGEDDYFFATNSGSIMVGAVLSRKGFIMPQEEYILTVRNKSGQSVASIRSDIDPTPPGFLSAQWRGFMGDLYQMARRRALRVEQVLEDVLGDIASIGSEDDEAQ